MVETGRVAGWDILREGAHGAEAEHFVFFGCGVL